jgi:hypothetical protein
MGIVLFVSALGLEAHWDVDVGHLPFICAPILTERKSFGLIQLPPVSIIIAKTRCSSIQVQIDPTAHLKLNKLLHVK